MTRRQKKKTPRQLMPKISSTADERDRTPVRMEIPTVVGQVRADRTVTDCDAHDDIFLLTVVYTSVILAVNQLIYFIE